MVVLVEKSLCFDSWFTWWFRVIYQGHPLKKTPMLVAVSISHMVQLRVLDLFSGFSDWVSI